MTGEQIFKQAIEKAVKGGWSSGYEKFPHLIDELIEKVSYQSVIFSHDFAKAFWGEEEIQVGEGYMTGLQPMWEHQLINMVLEPEPLKYLEKFL